MQPESSYERGYCRPECNKCAQVCPAGAIEKITVEQKSSIQIGHAVWVKENCLAAKGKKCDNCAHHCPAGAIQMVETEIDGKSRRIPVVNETRCIGCGACENLCPARPISAITVNGRHSHLNEN
jgi:formate hydrogenlyase subunit 6/NADH:ubiquinone oxidoreductase subunit I